MKIGIVGMLVRRSFFVAFVSFSGRSDPRPARAGAVETQFFISEVASKKVRLSAAFLEHFWHKSLPNSINNGLRLDLEHKHSERWVFNELGLRFVTLLATPCGRCSFLATFWPPYGASLACFSSMCALRASRDSLPASFL